MRLFRSLSFRLAILYIALFISSVLLLGGLYYWVAIARPLAMVRDDLAKESQIYRRMIDREGIEATAIALERRAAEESSRAAYHTLLTSNGDTVTANLPSWPQKRGDRWIRIEADVARQGDEDEYEALVVDDIMPSAERLMLGRDIEDLDELEEGIKDTALWLLPALVLLGILGGALMSRAIGRRLDSVSTAARAVIQGDLSERIVLRGTGDDFDRLGETLNLMLARIEEALEGVRRVSDTVVHELRTPIARLQSSLIALQEERQSPPVAEAMLEAERLGLIVDAVLRIARIEADRHRLECEPLSLSKLAEDAVEFYLPEAEGKDQSIRSEIAPQMIVEGDRHLLFQAVANLLDNAVKFSPRETNILVSVQPADANRIRLSVQDEGPGVPSEHLERLSERFFRGPGTTDLPGLGLGLSLAAAVAKSHHSTISFRSSGKGLCVEWLFPAAANGVD